MVFTSTEDDKAKNEKIEIQLLLEAIHLKYGYDFRNYSRKHIERRVLFRLHRSNLTSVADMLHRVITDSDFFHTLLLDLSVNVTEMFRDPHFFSCVRENIIPFLHTYPFVKIWHAGCSSGEEVYSMAILLKEEGLLDRTTLYATDFNQVALKKATEGIYPVEKIKEYIHNYNKTDAKASLSDYFTVKYGAAKINDELKQHIVFSDHNLVCDGVFGDMNLIICRNVIIYFDKELQDKVINLFYDSLVSGGILCLGSRESLVFSRLKDKLTEIQPKIYKKIQV